MAYTKPSGVNSLWAASGDKTTVPSAKVSAGWVAEKPSYQYFNQILYNLGLYDAYANERGIVEWDSGTTYVANKSYIVGSDGSLYQCRVGNSNQNPVLDDGSYWKLIANGQGVAAWNVLFDYNAGDLVFNDDELWLATADSTGVEPTSSATEWDKIVRSNDLGTAAYLSTSDVYNASNLASGTVASARLPNSTTSVKGVVELATQSEVDAGTDTSRVVTADTLANSSLSTAVTALEDEQFAVNQTVTDVTASRVINTTYTNSTNKPICVYIQPSNRNSTTRELLVDGIVVFTIYPVSNGDAPSTMFAIVPPSSTYRFNTIGTFNYWKELR